MPPTNVKYQCVGVYAGFNFPVNFSALESKILHITKISRYTVYRRIYWLSHSIHTLKLWLEIKGLKFNRKCAKFVSGFALTQILKLHPRDNNKTLSHSKLAQSLYTYPEAMARNRRTVNLTESVQNLFQDLR